jgi:dolichol-phosphate mannosyltransferase
MKKHFISIVAPMFNEAETVEEYCSEMVNVFSHLDKQYEFELLLVNDGSDDTTLEIMHNMQKKHPNVVTIMNLSRNFGLEGAIYAGLQKASGDAVIVMDADLQDPPKLVEEMLKEWIQGADVVNGYRVKREHDTFFKRKTAELYYKTLSKLAGRIHIVKNASMYRLLSKRALEQLLLLPESNRNFRSSIPYLGMRAVAVQYEREKRHAGKTKFNMKSSLHSAFDGITAISTAPLRKLSVFIVISMFLLLCFTAGAIVFSDTWSATFIVCAVISLFFTMLFICVSVISEYIGQIMLEGKKRPISIIYEYLPSENTRARMGEYTQ